MVTVSGKISFFRGRYQITNPTHVNTDKNKIKKYILTIVLQKESQIIFLIKQ